MKQGPSKILLLISLLPVLLTAGCRPRTVPETPKQTWDTFSDTWVGVDGLGRVLPTEADVGAPRPQQTVGIFYSLSMDHALQGPFDNTKILEQHPEALNDVHNPAWGPLNSSHHWGEPLFGYYASDDEWVARKHAQMLVNAGVDVVIFDNSNGDTYAKARDTICKAWEDIRSHGGKTPQIAFLCPFGNIDSVGTETLGELYDSFYRPGRFADLWFRWNGKPLILADSYFASEQRIQTVHHSPVEVDRSGSLGQTFKVDRPFNAIGGEFSTFGRRDCELTLSLISGDASKTVVSSQSFKKILDNSTVLLERDKPWPAGEYTLEASRPLGRVGWWSYTSGKNRGAFQSSKPALGDRLLHVRYVGESEAITLPSPFQLSNAQASERARQISEFFTFRTPIGTYDLKHPAAGQWAWLQIFPQTPQMDPSGKLEEIAVGVAQNYNSKDRQAPMSIPGAYGRSFRDGKSDLSPGSVRQGYNFGEQWKHALQVDPPFVFVTGWNEWTAGFNDHWQAFHAPPPIFVDEFTEEYSRDIEPMRGGHGDDYYYQLVANSRRYKGVRSLNRVTSKTIVIDGKFDDWKDVGPEYRDSIGDTTHRDANGFGSAGPYVNATGRNDFVAAKVCLDSKNVYFYVRTRDKVTPSTDPDWMLLYINSDADYKTGWLGYDFVVNRHVGVSDTSLERNVGNRYEWSESARVRFAVRGSELEVAIPLAALGIHRFPAKIDFKWADHCFVKGDWTDFTLNGDAAPDDRFNYRALLPAPPK